MERGREDEADARAFEHLGHALGREGQIDAERGEHIGRTRRTARGLVAVLQHRDGCGGGDHRGGRRDVHGAEPVAARADDVEGHRVDRERQRVLQDRVAEPDDLIDCLTFEPERDEESGKLGVGRLTGHDLLHRPRGIRHTEVLAEQERIDHGGPGLERSHAEDPICAIPGGFPGPFQAVRGFESPDSDARRARLTKTQPQFRP